MVGKLYNCAKRYPFSYCAYQRIIARHVLNANCYMQLETTENWEDSIDDIIINFERQNNRKLVYSISYY